jgi:hypothetical protein
VGIGVADGGMVVGRVVLVGRIVRVGVGVMVRVAVGSGVKVLVGVGVLVGIGVSVGVILGVAVGVGGTQMLRKGIHVGGLVPSPQTQPSISPSWTTRPPVPLPP